MWVLAQLFKFLNLAISILTFFFFFFKFKNSMKNWVWFDVYITHLPRSNIVYICKVFKQISYKYGVLQLIKTNHLPL
jgi:hypothetical protein